MFQSELIKTDVTVVKLVNNYILAGIGNFLHIFNDSGKFIKKFQIFNGHKIHGIVIKNTSFFLYGGCFMQTLQCHLDSVQVKFLCNEKIRDWILTAQWLNGGLVGVVVMKNALLIFNENLILQRQINCGEKCILYSAFISYDCVDELVVFSGTVFSEILIWKVSQTESRDTCVVLAKLKGHKGVIFSVNYNSKVGYICSSSDDRSSILWSVESKCIHAELKRKTPEISLVRKFYGHQSRVFRSAVLDDVLITAGEDSLLNVWNFEGELLNKITTHHGGPVWSFDCRNNMIVAGGGGCGVLLASITSNTNYQQLALSKNEIPKHVGFVGGGSVVVITESGNLYSNYPEPAGKLEEIGRYEDLKGYCLMEISKCGNLFALAGYHGEIYICRVLKNSIALVAASKTNRLQRICSLHWLTCQTFITCEENGILNLWYLHKHHPLVVTTFHLPGKEHKGLWTTTACQGPNGRFVVGDRRGNIYVYQLTNSTPIQAFKKAHSYLGITQLCTFGKRMVSLGRDGNVKTYLWADKCVEEFSTDKASFSWLCRLTLENWLLGFSGNNFVVWDYKTRRKLLEQVCGGGHRSWDFCKIGVSPAVVFVKDRVINRVQWNDKGCVEVVSDYHCSTINSVAVLPLKDKFVVVSGSDDTHLRISIVGDNYFQSVKNLKSHLSNIKAVWVHQLTKCRFLVFTGGGRGQIICWSLLVDEKDCDCRQESSHYEATSEAFSESEMRIMDLRTLQQGRLLLLYAAASDGNVYVFVVQKTSDGNYSLQLRKKLFHRLKCISKLHLLKRRAVCLLVTMSTDGAFVFWNVSHVVQEDVVPLHVIATHQSTVTTRDFRFVDDNTGLFLSGGDDGSIVVTLFKIGANCVVRVGEFRDVFSHCAQVTGAWIGAGHFFTTSVDQKLLVFDWSVSENSLICKRRGRYDSAVADIQGMECEEGEDQFHVFLYGKGLEYVVITKKALLCSRNKIFVQN